MAPDAVETHPEPAGPDRDTAVEARDTESSPAGGGVVRGTGNQAFARFAGGLTGALAPSTKPAGTAPPMPLARVGSAEDGQVESALARAVLARSGSAVADPAVEEERDEAPAVERAGAPVAGVADGATSRDAGAEALEDEDQRPPDDQPAVEGEAGRAGPPGAALEGAPGGEAPPGAALDGGAGPQGAALDGGAGGAGPQGAALDGGVGGAGPPAATLGGGAGGAAPPGGAVDGGAPVAGAAAPPGAAVDGGARDGGAQGAGAPDGGARRGAGEGPAAAAMPAGPAAAPTPMRAGDGVPVAAAPPVDLQSAGPSAALLERIAQHREHVIASADAAKQRVRGAADTEIANVRGAGETESQRVATAAADGIRDALRAVTDAEGAVESARTEQKGRVNSGAKEQLKALDGAVAKRQGDVRKAAHTRADQAVAHGEKEAERALSACRLKAADAIVLGATKAEAFKPTKRGGRKARAAREIAAETSKEMIKAGDEMAKTARADAKKLADKFRREGEDAAKKLSGAQLNKARERIEGRRAKAVEAIDTAADQTLAGVRRDRDTILPELRTQQSEAGKLLLVAEAAVRAVEQHHADVCDAIERRTKEIVEGLDAATAMAENLAGLREADAAAAIASLDELVGEVDADLDREATSAHEAMSTATANAGEVIVKQAGMLTEPVTQGVTSFLGQVAKGTESTVNGMRSEADDATGDMRETFEAVDGELAKAVTEATSGWDKELREGLAEITKKVDDGVKKQQETLDGLGKKIDERAQEIHDESWWSRAWSFTKGLLGGFLGGLWNMVTFLGKLVLVVIAVVVVALIVGAIIGGLAGVLAVLGAIAAVVGFIASIGTFLLVLAVVIVTVVVAFRIYRLATDDSLTDYERGELVGESLFDVGSLIFGAKVAKWLGGLTTAGAQAQRLARLRKLLQNDELLGLLLKLGDDGVAAEQLVAKLGGNVDRLKTLLVLCGDDAVRLDGLLRRLGPNADRAEDLLRAAGADANKVDDALTKAGDDVEEALKLLRKPPEPEPPPASAADDAAKGDDAAAAADDAAKTEEPPKTEPERPPKTEEPPKTEPEQPPKTEEAPKTEPEQPPKTEEPPAADPAAEARAAKFKKQVDDELAKRGLSGDPTFKDLDRLTVEKVAKAFESDPLKAGKAAAQKWALDGARGNPREFANRYEYVKARFLYLRDQAMKPGAPGGPKSKAQAVDEAAKGTTTDKLDDALRDDLADVAALGPGGLVAPGSSPDDIAAAVQKLDRVAFETPTAEAYHAAKHMKDVPPMAGQTGNYVKDYAAAAKETIQTGKITSVKEFKNPDAVRVAIRKLLGEPPNQVEVEAVIYVTPDGMPTLATFGKPLGAR